MDKRVADINSFTAKEVLEYFCHPSNFVAETIEFDIKEYGGSDTKVLTFNDSSVFVTEILVVSTDQDGDVLDLHSTRDLFKFEMTDHNRKPFFVGGIDLYNLSQFKDLRRFNGLMFEFKADYNLTITSKNIRSAGAINNYSASSKYLKHYITFVGYRLTEEIIGNIVSRNPELQRGL